MQLAEPIAKKFKKTLSIKSYWLKILAAENWKKNTEVFLGSIDSTATNWLRRHQIN